MNRWKTDCLRLLRRHLGGDSEAYRAFGDLVDRAGVLWRAIEPGMELLARVRAQYATGGAGAA